MPSEKEGAQVLLDGRQVRCQRVPERQLGRAYYPSSLPGMSCYEWEWELQYSRGTGRRQDGSRRKSKAGQIGINVPVPCLFPCLRGVATRGASWVDHSLMENGCRVLDSNKTTTAFWRSAGCGRKPRRRFDAYSHCCIIAGGSIRRQHRRPGQSADGYNGRPESTCHGSTASFGFSMPGWDSSASNFFWQSLLTGTNYLRNNWRLQPGYYADSASFYAMDPKSRGGHSKAALYAPLSYSLAPALTYSTSRPELIYIDSPQHHNIYSWG
ncbi:hypothetical protein PGT21_033140 [Puccinia graminis f. sp. tritici]|uniref:Uncharacterized protein n=1 Tax=Puccinia graminis f. sp. tritici TaxID=56615 RepID=A0A5B0QC48_PUCGR|nr:hypothetical protein PGT21_033140 [Puccinia graminis f. sp. tritici]